MGLRVILSKMKHLIGDFDKNFMGGVLHSLLETISRMKRGLNEVDEDHIFLDRKSHFIENQNIRVRYSKEVEVSTIDFLLMQYNEDNCNEFERLDCAVRYLAIENYDGNNDFGIELDNKVQELWVGEVWEERFRKLIESVKSNGFDTSYQLETNYNMKLLDGTHRCALAFYTNQEFIKVILNNTTDYLRCGTDFFWSLGLDKEDILRIKNKAQWIESQLEYDFAVIIWNPARELFDVIIDDLNSYNQNNFSVVEHNDIFVEELEYDKLMRGIYFSDVIPLQHIEQKISLNKSHSSLEDGKYLIRVARLHVRRPNMKLKPESGLPKSIEMLKLKEAIRNRHKGEIDGYERDMMIHIADNYIQSEFCFRLFEMDKSLVNLFRGLNNSDLKYVVVKTNERQHSEFPKNFYYSTDIDIVVRREDLKLVGNKVFEWVNSKYSDSWMDITIDEGNDETQVWVRMKGFWIIMFHIQCILPGINYVCMDKLIDHRIKIGSVYRLEPEYEIAVRAGEWTERKDKTHHIEFIKHNKMYYKENIIDELLVKRNNRLLKRANIFEE